jgi:hypothetical protein
MQVIVHLNTANENNEFERKKLRDTHAEEISTIREESQSKIEQLQNEIKAKEKALQELTARSIAKEKETQKRLVTAQSEASARELELQNRHEEEIKSRTEMLSNDLSSQTEIARELALKLEELSKQHRSEVATLRDELKKETQLGLKTLREELTNSHSHELHCLKSQHDRATAQVKVDALEHERVEVENAVTLVRAEYEQKIYQQMIQHNEKYQAIKADLNETLNNKITNLQVELEDAQAIAREIPGLKAKIYEHSDNEKKLQSEVRRLQDSLDSSASSNQHIINELKKENDQLRGELRDCNRSLSDRVQRIDSLGVQVCCYFVDFCVTTLIPHFLHKEQ